MPDFWCWVIDAGINTITLADAPAEPNMAPAFERVQFCPNSEDKKAMLAIGLVAMTSGRKVWVRVDAADEGSIIRDIVLGLKSACARKLISSNKESELATSRRKTTVVSKSTSLQPKGDVVMRMVSGMRKVVAAGALGNGRTDICLRQFAMDPQCHPVG